MADLLCGVMHLIAVCKAHPDWGGMKEEYIEEEAKAVCTIKRKIQRST